MKTILAPLLLILVSVTAGAAESKPYDTQKFIEATGLKPGEYHLVKGPKECLQGELEILESENHFSVRLGSPLLLMGLGSKPYDLKEKDCTISVDGRFRVGQASTTRVEKCPKKKMIYQTDVKKTEKGFNYTSVIHENKKKSLDIKCELEAGAALDADDASGS